MLPVKVRLRLFELVGSIVAYSAGRTARYQSPSCRLDIATLFRRSRHGARRGSNRHHHHRRHKEFPRCALFGYVALASVIIATIRFSRWTKLASAPREMRDGKSKHDRPMSDPYGGPNSDVFRQVTPLNRRERVRFDASQSCSGAPDATSGSHSSGAIAARNDEIRSSNVQRAFGRYATSRWPSRRGRSPRRS